MLIQVSNHGPLITATNYWSSDLAAAGKVFCSVNASAIRVLLPRARWNDLNDMRQAQYCVLSRGPWTAPLTEEARRMLGLPNSIEVAVTDGVEIMFEDGSDNPYALFLTAESFDMLPAEPEAGREWIISVWIEKDGRPHKSLERICHWRRVDKIPCLRAWIV